MHVRMRVEHVKGPAAENVEVVATRAWNVRADGERLEREEFLPLNLTWSHVGGATMRIPAGLFRHCDVGHFQPDGKGACLFVLDTLVLPNIMSSGASPTVLPPGNYEIEFRIVGDNTPHKSVTWRVYFPAAWSDDEKTMLGNITIGPV